MKYKNGPKNNLAMYFVQVSIVVTLSIVQIYLNQNTPGVKKLQPRILKSHAEKDVKSKWAAKASCC